MGLALLFTVGALVVAGVFLFTLVHDARFPSRATMGWALGRGLPVDPAAMGFDSIEVTWGKRQPAWRIKGGAVDGPITIIIHGWRRSRIDSLRRIHPWWSASSEVWLIDLDGHGDSIAGPTTLGAHDVESIVALVQDLVAPDPGIAARAKRVLLVGHSLGASIALRTAVHIAESELAGVVAFAPYESLKEPLGNRLRAQALPAIPFAHLGEACLHALCGRETSTRDALKKLHERKVALLVVAAEFDRVISHAHVQGLAEHASVAIVIDQDSAHDDLGTNLQLRTESTTSRAAHEFLSACK